MVNVPRGTWKGVFMDLLKYLEPMKDLPKRFSNLAFWRDVRKFKDEVVNALEYVDSWGEHIENSITKTTPTIKYQIYNMDNNSSFTGSYDQVNKTINASMSSATIDVPEHSVIVPISLGIEIKSSSGGSSGFYYLPISNTYISTSGSKLTIPLCKSITMPCNDNFATPFTILHKQLFCYLITF